MRTFYIRDAFGPQNGPSLAVAYSGRQVVRGVRTLDPGEYTVRDALGGLRYRLRKSEDGQVDLLERTK